MNEIKLAKLNSFVLVTFACGAVLTQCFKIITVCVSYFNIPYWDHEGHCHCQNNIPNTIPYHSIICTTAFTLPSFKLYHHLKIRPVSASQSVYTTQSEVTMQKWHCCSKDFLFSSSFSDILWMFLLLRNTYVLAYTSLQCMAWYARIQS